MCYARVGVMFMGRMSGGLRVMRDMYGSGYVMVNAGV